MTTTIGKPQLEINRVNNICMGPFELMLLNFGLLEHMVHKHRPTHFHIWTVTHKIYCQLKYMFIFAEYKVQVTMKNMKSKSRILSLHIYIHYNIIYIYVICLWTFSCNRKGFQKVFGNYTLILTTNFTLHSLSTKQVSWPNPFPRPNGFSTHKCFF